jgi:hypothetical protein
MNYKKIDAYGYPVAILVLAILSFMLVNALNPSLYSSLIGSYRIILCCKRSTTHWVRVMEDN